MHMHGICTNSRIYAAKALFPNRKEEKTFVVSLRRGGQLKTRVMVNQVMQRLGMTKLGLI